MCRVTLEGILEDLNPGSRKPLYQRLEELARTRDLATPLHKLADILRVGGNTGAHFDPNRTPTREAAEGMLSLTEYLLEYLYTLPRLVDELEKHLDQLDQTGGKV